MAQLMSLRIYGFFIFLSGYLYSFGQCQDIDIGVFESLSEAHKKWLQYNSIPELARFLKYPPHSYHSRKLATDSFNLLDLYSGNSSYLQDAVMNSEIKGKCSDDVSEIVFNPTSSYALQMLDSDGKIASGLYRGGLLWPGHYSECINVYAPLDKNGHGDFHGQYCVSNWVLNLTEKYSDLPLMIGLCIPDSCKADRLEIVMLIVPFILDYIPGLKGLEGYLKLDSIECKPKERSVDAAGIIYLTIVSVFILLSVLGSLLTLYDKWKLKNAARANTLSDTALMENHGALQARGNSVNIDTEGQISEKQSAATVKKEVSGNRSALTLDTTELQTAVSHAQQPVPVIKRILLCFSIFTNGQKIITVGNVDGQLLSIHGIRFLSLTWVILGHTYITSVKMIGNTLDVLNEMDSFPFQMLLQAPFSVDSFFLLSGFLLTYLFLKEATKKNGKISWLYFYVHRIWRLTPSYVIVVFFYMLIFKYLGSGPFWHDNNCDNDRSTWWMYLLYLNNFIDIDDMCVGWSWYLANDMQFYVISPLFLYPLWRWPKAGFAILGSLLVATWTTTGIISYTNNLFPMFVGATQATDIAAYEKEMWRSFDLIYDKPYCRIAPYIIGVILGYALHKTAGKKNFLNRWQQLLGWAVAAFCSLSVVFGLYHVEMSRTVALFYNAFCRSSFAIGLAWLIYACETGHGGVLTDFLSMKLWIPLSRLTYSAYLVHPMLIHGYYQALQSPLIFTQLIAVTNFLGFLLMSYGLAFAFSLVFESPFMNLEKLIIKRKAG